MNKKDIEKMSKEEQWRNGVGEFDITYDPDDPHGMRLAGEFLSMAFSMGPIKLKPKHEYLDIIVRDKRYAQNRNASATYRAITHRLKSTDFEFASYDDARVRIRISPQYKEKDFFDEGRFVNTIKRYEGDNITLSSMLARNDQADEIVKSIANAISSSQKLHLVYDESIEKGWYVPEPSQLTSDEEEQVKLLEDILKAR